MTLFNSVYILHDHLENNISYAYTNIKKLVISL